MKRIIVALALLAVSSLAVAQTSKWRQGDSILKPNVGVLVPGHGYRLIPFIDKENGKIGFLGNSSSLVVAVPPTYDDGYFSIYMLMPVLKDGKWGVMDLGARYTPEGHHYTDPIIPCVYDKVEVVDNDHVRVYRNGESYVREISTGMN